MAACKVNDPLEDEKIKRIAKEADRLWVLLVLNGVYDSNEFQNVSYKLNDLLHDKYVSEYRTIYNDLIIDTIKSKRNLSGDIPLLDFNNFLQKNYTNTNTRFLRYLFARIEKFICEQTHQTMQNDVRYISTKTGYKTGYQIEHILSHNDTNRNYFASDEEFEDRRNLLGGLLLLKGADNISSGNEEYKDKLKTYSNELVWGHSLCSDFYHTNKDFNTFNTNFKAKTKTEYGFKPYTIFDQQALMERCHLLYELIKVIWEA
jgi:hypothetical protein